MQEKGKNSCSIFVYQAIGWRKRMGLWYVYGVFSICSSGRDEVAKPAGKMDYGSSCGGMNTNWAQCKQGKQTK